MKALFKFFLLLGATGFGGPLALVQLMREEFVDRQQKMTQQEFDQVFTMIKAMPGPVAFQMAVFLGNRFFGVTGGFAAGMGLILPSFIMICGLAYFYENLTQFTNFKFILEGFLFSVSAIILLSLKSMFLNSYKKKIFWLLLVLSLYVVYLNFIPEPLLIMGAGMLALGFNYNLNSSMPKLFNLSFLLIDWEKIYSLFKTCLYGGAFVFGTGLAILPVLKNEFVDQLHWLTLQEFNDGVIFGQMTPGPVTITASFLGYRIHGILGAFVATLGIFISPFIHMVTWFPLAVKWLSRQKWIGVFLVGATSAVIATILMTVFNMNFNSMNKMLFWMIFCGTGILLIYKPKTSLIKIILLSGLLNLLVNLATMNSIQ